MATETAAPIITVKRDWTRTDPALVDRFRDAPSGNVSDSANRGNSLAPEIKPVTPEFRFCGTALTVDAGKHDNLAFWVALDKVQPGDVMVVATQGHRDCAVIGDLIITFARNRGCVAVVTDGMIRDVEAVGEIGIPVFAAGIRPSGPDKAGPGSVGLPVWIAGQRVEPGDIVVGDRDGVVVVPRAMAASAAERLDAIAAKEAGMEADGKAGKLYPGNIDSFLGGVVINEVD
ncbi:MAG: RraA family protein [Pseudomonadota bacterium]